MCYYLIIIFRNNNREYENKKFDLRARKDIFSVDDLPQVNFQISKVRHEIKFILYKLNDMKCKDRHEKLKTAHVQ